jgi:large subunit ribosomal protein L25
VRGDVMHVDFQEVDLTQEIEAPIPLMLVGSAVGVREGGVLDQPLREVIVSALPDALPDHLEVDVSELNVGDSVSVGQIAPPAGVVIVTDPETTIASVVAPSAVIVEEEVEEEVEGEIVEGADAEGGGPDDE